jgi:uncharacterized protein YfaS (alpha-2-macroglobulin family)
MKKKSSILLFFLMVFYFSSLYAKENFDVVSLRTSAEYDSSSNQFVIQFNRPVVTYESQRTHEIPIEITPHLDCEWQWLNDMFLVCFLPEGETFTLATKYNVKIKKEFKTYDDAELGQDKFFSFTSLRPDVSNVEIVAWKDSGKPVFKITFNQFVNVESLNDEIFITPGDINTRSKIRLLDEKNYLSDHQIEQYHKKFKRAFPNNDADEKQNKLVVFFEPEENLDFNAKLKVFAGSAVESSFGRELIMGPKEVFEFKTFDKPRLIGISCTNFKNGQYHEVQIGVDDEFDETKKCLPNMGINLNFSSPIFVKEILKYLHFTPELNGNIIKNIYERLIIADEEKKYGYYAYRFDSTGSGFYSINLYGEFLANRSYNIQSVLSQKDELPNKLKNLFNFSKKDEDVHDLFRKEFKQKINFDFTLDHHQPELFFPKNETINVLEKSTDVDLVINSRNFKDILVKYNIITSDEKKKNQKLEKVISGEEDSFARTSLEIRKLLNEKSGLVFGELIANPDESKYSQYKTQFLTQVTNVGVIAKIGHYNSLIFVVDLTTGEAISDAKVSIIRSKFLEFNGEDSDVVAKGVTNEDGILILPGTEDFDKNLKALTRYYDSDGLTIQVKKKDEMGWLPIRYDHAMFGWQAPELRSLSSKKYGHLNGWAFTSQGIYKPDQDVNYKLYIRNNSNEKVVLAPDLTYNLAIKDSTANLIFEEKDIKLSDFGTHFGQYKLSKNAKSGWYDIVVYPNVQNDEIVKEEYEQDMNLYLGRFLVSDFKTASFKLRTELNKKDVFYKNDLEITNYAELYSGGAFTNANVNVNVDIEPLNFSSKLPIAQGFNFSDLEKYKDLFLANISSKSGKTDLNGEFSDRVKIENDKIPYGKIVVDSSVQDDSGKSIASRSYANYFGVDRFVGLKAIDFFFNVGQKSIIQSIVINSDGELLEDVDIHIDIQYGENNVAQLRSGGDQYISKSSIDWKLIDSCDIKSKLDISQCEFNFDKAGDYRAIARIKDSRNLESTSSINFVVFDGSNRDLVWNQQNNETFDIIPEKTSYKVGEKARFLVKNPLIGAHALITTERYGVIKHFTKKFDKSIEILEFDLDEKDVPGFYLSVVLTAPRVKDGVENVESLERLKNINESEKIKSIQENKEDEKSEREIQLEKEAEEQRKNELHKPIAKIGYSRIYVENPENKIDIDITTTKEIYKPKEKATVKFTFGHDNKADEAEVAVIVMDEAVLDLISGKINYFNPRESFGQLQALDVTNFSLFKTILTNSRAMMKGVDVGGDGGLDFSIRSNFLNIAYWNPSIILKRGESAEIQFEIPDNLTSWRVIAISNDKGDLFGLNDKSFKVNKETEIRPLLPDHVLTGDRFDGGFTIFNRSDKVRNIAYEVNLDGLISKSREMKSLYHDVVTVEPFTRKIVKFPVLIEQINEENIALFKDGENSENKISIMVKVNDEIDNDAAQYSVKILPAVRFENHFNNKIIEGGSLKTQITLGDEVIGEMSSLKIGLNNTVLSNLPNIFASAKSYQYDCFEQKLSRMFVGANYFYLKNGILKSNYNKIFGDFEWIDIESEIKALYDEIPNYQAENGGMSYYLASDNYASPYLSAMTLSTLLKFEKIFPAEKLSDLSKVKERLILYLDNLLKNDFQNRQYDQVLQNDARAVILEGFAIKDGKQDEILRFKDNFEKMSLFGMAKILNGGIISKIDESLVKKWWSGIMKYAIFDGAQYVYFQKDKSGFYSPLIHASRYTENCAILSTAVNLQKSGYDIENITGLNKENFQNLLGKIASAIINRQDGKKNFNTHEAIVCTDAIIQYGLINENLKLSGEKVEIQIGDKSNLFLDKEFAIPGVVDVKDLSGLVGKRAEIDVSIKNNEEKNKNLYYSSHLSLAKVLNFNEATNHGIGISRRYQIENNGKFFDLKDFNQISNGSILRVMLSISVPFDKYFVVAYDYIPGCFEPIDQNQNTALRISDDNKNNSYFYYRDLKQSYARFYSDFLPKGFYEVSYLVQVVSNGAFDVLPAVVKEMYNEESFGATSSQKVAILDSS